MRFSHLLAGAVFLIAFIIVLAAAGPKTPPKVLTGKAAFADYSQEKPGIFRKITRADLPPPFATESADAGSEVVARPQGAWPQALPGFKVELYASGLDNPRLICTAPNGDLFLAESRKGEIKVFRGVAANGAAEKAETFATGLTQPFGIAFYPPGPDPQFVYVANTDSVVRFAYQKGDMKASAAPQVIVAQLPGGGRLRGGGHWTRDIAFSRDGKKMYVSVGSRSNNDDTDNNPREEHRADILEFSPAGSAMRGDADGLPTAELIAKNPQSGHLWASVGPGTISAATKIRATRASIPNLKTRSLLLTFYCNRTSRRWK